jgi:hypothetical protein
MPERGVMMMLLRRADNGDASQIPVWRQPTENQLAAEIPVDVRRLKLILRHLKLHGWVDWLAGVGRPPLDKSKPTKSRRNTYRPFPQGTPEPCRPPCPGVDPRGNKRGCQRPLSEVEKVVPEHQEKGVPESESSQVSTHIAPRDHQGEGLVKGRRETERIEWLGSSERTYPASWKSWAPGSIGERP